MIFAPHILQVKVITPMDKDEFGRPIPGTGGEYWQEVCKCRCDDNTTKEFSSDNGSVYRPNYHVVCEKRITVKAGDEVRCMDGDSVRGQGEVYTVKSTNYFRTIAWCKCDFSRRSSGCRYVYSYSWWWLYHPV